MGTCGLAIGSDGLDIWHLAKSAANPWRHTKDYEDHVQEAAIAIWQHADEEDLSYGQRVVIARRRIIDTIRLRYGRANTYKSKGLTNTLSFNYRESDDDAELSDLIGIVDPEPIDFLILSLTKSDREIGIMKSVADGELLSTIGDRLGVTESRVSQILRQIGRRQSNPERTGA